MKDLNVHYRIILVFHFLTISEMASFFSHNIIFENWMKICEFTILFNNYNYYIKRSFLKIYMAL